MNWIAPSFIGKMIKHLYFYQRMWVYMWLHVYIYTCVCVCIYTETVNNAAIYMDCTHLIDINCFSFLCGKYIYTQKWDCWIIWYVKISLFWNRHIVFHSDWNNLHSLWQCIGFFFTISSICYLLSSSW